MIDPEIYYHKDHRGHGRISDILRYGLTCQDLLTNDECNFAADYYACIRKMVNNQTLHLQRKCPWNRLNYRYGWDSVKGTQAEFLAIIIWNFFNKNTTLRLEAEFQEEQERGKDLVAVNSRWVDDYVVQVKCLTRGNDPKQMKIDPDKVLCYDPKYVDRLILVDIDNLTIYHFSYSSFKLHYEKCEKYHGGYIDDNFRSVKNFHKFTLPENVLRERFDSIILNR